MKRALSWCAWIVGALVVGYLLRTNVVGTARVVGSSMEPTLYSSDIVMVTKFDYWFSGPSRGDVTLCRLPEHPLHVGLFRMALKDFLPVHVPGWDIVVVVGFGKGLFPALVHNVQGDRLPLRMLPKQFLLTPQGQLTVGTAGENKHEYLFHRLPSFSGLESALVYHEFVL